MTAAGRSVGQYVHLRGWNSGVQVSGRPDESNGRDEFAISITGGSHGHLIDVLGFVRQDENGEPYFVLNGYVKEAMVDGVYRPGTS